MGSFIKFPVKNGHRITTDMLEKYEPFEAWLIFRMDILVARKPADVLILLDIGSGYVFGHIIVLNEMPSSSELENLMNDAYKLPEHWPKILYCSQNDPAKELFENSAVKKGIFFEDAPSSVFYEITSPVIETFGSFQKSIDGGGKRDEWKKPSEEEIMARSLIPDSYDPCPCASGKKFKFCCKPVFAEIIEAMVSAEKGNTQRALKCLDEAKEKVGETPEILCRYAIVYSFFDKKKSCDYINRCLALNPRHPRANYIRGIDLKEKKKYKEALKAYEIAAANYPSGDRFHLNEVWNNIGTVYYELGDYMNARQAWEKARDYMPEDDMVLRNLKLLDEMDNTRQ